MPQFAANVTTPFLERALLDCFGAAKEAESQGVKYLLSFDFDKESPATRLTASRICSSRTIPGRNSPGNRGNKLRLYLRAIRPAFG
jgi:hydroxypyruvate isomerase